jgi:hypothetical protein
MRSFKKAVSQYDIAEEIKADLNLSDQAQIAS